VCNRLRDDGILQVCSHRSDGTHNSHPTIVSLRRAREHFKQFCSRLHQQTHVHNSLNKHRTLYILQKRILPGDFQTRM